MYAGHGRDDRWQPQGEIGVQHRHIGQQDSRRHAGLGGFTRGDHRNRCHLRPGPRSGWHKDKGKACSGHLVHTIVVRTDLGPKRTVVDVAEAASASFEITTRTRPRTDRRKVRQALLSSFRRIGKPGVFEKLGRADAAAFLRRAN